jgi:O-antigen ligase
MTTLALTPVAATRRVERAAPAWWETGFVAVALLLAANAFIPLVFNPGIDAPPPPGTPITSAPAALYDPLSQPFWALLSLFIVGTVVRYGRGILATLVRNPGLVAVCYLAAVSTLWSSVPKQTLQYAVELGFSTVLGVYIGLRFGLRRLVRLLSWLTVVIAVASLVFALALKKYGVDPSHNGAWRGVFGTKNELGRMMAFGGVVWATRLLERDVSRRTGLGALALMLTLGIGSGSRTALGVTGLMAGVLALAVLLAKPGRKWVATKGAVVAGTLALAVAVVTNLKLLLHVVGSDYHLTGRTSIWAAVVTAIGVHPWFGYGYDAFWRGIAGPSLAVWRQAQTNPPHSHNGFLDLLLNLGAAGAAAFVLSYLTAFFRSVRQLHQGRFGERFFPFAFLAFLLLYNLTESSLVDRRSLPWIAFVAVAAAITGPPRDGPAADSE